MNKEEKQESPNLQLQKFTKGYGWRINLWTYDIAELEKLNNEMIKKFGDKE